MKLQPGTEVTPNVRLESPIATGAMGSVWLAEHLTLNTKVAVKFISDRIDSDDPEVMERFVREASTAAQIKSSHVVQTFDQGVMRDGVPYIVMEYLEGVGLGEKLQSGGTLPIGQVQRIVMQTAKALASAHKLGIVHRDIKPDNIFLSTHDDELHIKVFDFGIAKHRRNVGRTTLRPEDAMPNESQPELGLTNDGVMIGTPEYMSPEQVMNASSVDHHADLWGLSVVAYVALTGTLPFTGSDVGELCVNLLEASFTPPTKIRSDLPKAVDAFFAKALARNPSDRYPSARELATEFQKCAPATSHPGDALASGSFAVRTSGPGLPVGEGVRGATFSGTEADAIRSRRLSPSAIGLLVVGVLVAGVAVAFSFGSGDGADVNEPDVTQAAAPPTTGAPDPEESSSASTASPAPSTNPSAISSGVVPPQPSVRKPTTFRPGVRPYVPQTRPSPPKPKSPGF